MACRFLWRRSLACIAALAADRLLDAAAQPLASPPPAADEHRDRGRSALSSFSTLPVLSLVQLQVSLTAAAGHRAGGGGGGAAAAEPSLPQDLAAVERTCDTYFDQTRCSWTERYPCEDQFQSSMHARDATPDGSEAYTCCCKLGLWRRALEGSLEQFTKTTMQVAMCERSLNARGCAWTASTPCSDQPRTSNFTHMAANDGTLFYKCCCTLGMWETHGADAALPATEEEYQQLRLGDNSSSSGGGGDLAATAASQECDDYMIEEGCSWTARWPCSGQPRGSELIREAGNDGHIGFKCCCQQEYWKKDRVGETIRAGPNELMFIHIPKNAGTLVEEVSSKGNISYPGTWPSFRHGVDMPDGSTCATYRVPPQYLRALGEPEQTVKPFKVPGTFCITRHPYERAVSEYLYALTVKWGPYMSSTYRTGLLEEQPCTPEGMNYFLQTALQKMKEGRKFLHGCHFLPQVEFIWGQDGYQWCKNIIRVDTLKDSFNRLMASRGYAPRIQDQTLDGTLTCGGNLTTASLSNATRSLIDTIYHNDFVMLNYTKGESDADEVD